jgi:UDP-N-acetylmuramate--alanine ligase
MDPANERLPQHIHLIGIGGSGLSAIARVLALRGHTVSGSDLHASALTAELGQLGVATYVGHAAGQLGAAEMVVVSSAVPEENPEVRAARERGIPVLKRQHFLGRLMAGYDGVAVAGTHGKTTTSAMVAVALERAGLEPSFIIGGVIGELGTNARAGRGRPFVIEADEYDRMFHGLRPRVAVVTNLEMDHPDCYPTLAELREAFSVFLGGVQPGGAIIAGADSPELARVLAGRPAGGPECVTYGYAAGAEYRVADVEPNGRGGVDFRVLRGGAEWGRVSLALPGAHNALNATAALLACARCGLAPAEAGRLLADFHGVRRRFEVKGCRAGVTVIDDYAHHPTEVRATLAAARGRYPGASIWAVFQPHTYSRMRALLGELVGALSMPTI